MFLLLKDLDLGKKFCASVSVYHFCVPSRILVVKVKKAILVYSQDVANTRWGKY